MYRGGQKGEKKMADTKKVTINGVEMEAPDGQTVLQLLNNSSIDVPHVCYHPSLGPIETCDTCIVNVNGELVRSCSAQIKDGDVIDTLSSDVKKRRLSAWTTFCTTMNCTARSVITTMGAAKYIIP